MTRAPRSKAAPARRSGDLTSRVRALLARVPRVQEKKMFGSVGFMVRGKLCIAARAERLMCRIDPEGHEAAVRRKGARTMVLKGREYRGYVHVDAASVRTPRALRHWVRLALEHNEALTSSPRGSSAGGPRV